MLCSQHCYASGIREGHFKDLFIHFCIFDRKKFSFLSDKCHPILKLEHYFKIFSNSQHNINVKLRICMTLRIQSVWILIHCLPCTNRKNQRKTDSSGTNFIRVIMEFYSIYSPIIQIRFRDLDNIRIHEVKDTKCLANDTCSQAGFNIFTTWENRWQSRL